VLAAVSFRQMRISNQILQTNKQKEEFLMNKTFYLPMMIVALLFLAVWAVYGQEQKTGKQTWEYRSLVLVRGAFTSGDFSEWWDRSGQNVKQLPLPVSMTTKASELGDQGWELVTVTPISNHSCQDCAGFTSQVTYWFKRPK
jgi:hypothetical protein